MLTLLMHKYDGYAQQVVSNKLRSADPPITTMLDHPSGNTGDPVSATLEEERLSQNAGSTQPVNICPFSPEGLF